MPPNDRLLRKSVKKDTNVNTANIINKLRVPTYSEEPIANGPGYIYYNSTDGIYYLSISSGPNWEPIQTSDGEALPPPLQSIANLVTSGGEMLYTTGTNTYAISPITATGRSFLEQPSVLAQQGALSLVPGSDVQEQNNLLQSVANQSGIVGVDNIFYTTSSATVQPTTLTSFARNTILTANDIGDTGAIQGPISTVNRLVRVAGNDIIEETGVSIDLSDNITNVNDLSVNGNVTIVGDLDSITPTIRTQLSHINGNTINTTQWGYLGELDQSLTTTSTPTFFGASMSSEKITGVGSPTDPLDATNKDYVDNIAATGAPPLDSVRLATTAVLPNAPAYASPAETLTSTTAPGSLTIDGVVVAVGDRILVKDQADDRENGIYTVTDDGSTPGPEWVLTRATDFNQASMPLPAGSTVFVQLTAGAVVNPGSTWALQNPLTTIDPLTDSVLFVQVGGGTVYTAGLGIDSALLTGGTIQTEISPRLTYAGNSIDINPPVSVAYGGTGDVTLTSNGVLIGDATNPVNTSKQAPVGDFVGTSDVQTLTNKTITSSSNNVTASNLFSGNRANTINVFSSPNPTSGQVLTAVDANNATWQAPSTGFEPNRTLFVYQGAPDVSPNWSSVVSAINDAISLTPTATDPITILIYPGLYTETSSIIIPPSVSLRGQGGPKSVIVERNTTADNVITMSTNSSCISLTVQGATDLGFAGFYYSVAPGNSPARIEDCITIDCSIGYYANGTGAKFSSILVLRHTSASSIVNATGEAGYIADNGGTIDSVVSVASGFFGGSIDVGYHVEGEDSLMTIAEANANFIDTGYLCQNTSGSGTAEMRVYSGELTFISSVGAFVGNRAIMRLFSIYFENDLALFPNQINVRTQSIASSPSLLQGSGLVLRTDLTDLDANTIIEGNALSVTPDEVQMQVLGEFIVGFPNRGSESVFGEGDSHTFSMQVVRANLSGGPVSTDNGTNFVDITSSVKLFDGTTTPAFSSLAAGEMLYVGGTITQFPGIVATLDTGILPAGGYSTYLTKVTVLEYWDGVAWTSFDIMSTERTQPYLSMRDEILDSGNYHYRFGNMPNWTQTILGGAITTNNYWIRIRLTNAITQIPTIDQIKLHTNRSEIDADGFIEYFGASRPEKIIQFDYSAFVGFSSNPLNGNIAISTALTIPTVAVRFRNNQSDRVAFNLAVPFETDTSFPLKLRLLWFTTTAGGNVIWNINFGFNSIDGSASPFTSVFSTGQPATSPNEVVRTVTTSSPSANTMYQSVIELDICQILPERASQAGDLLWIAITRDGGGDTNTGVVNITRVCPIVRVWCNGRY